MHMPIEIDIQYIEQLITPFFVSIPANGVEEVGDDDVGADDGVHGPFCAEEGERRMTTAAPGAGLVEKATSGYRE